MLPLQPKNMAGKNSALYRLADEDFAWAAPSWVRPGNIAENAKFLADKCAGIELCLFETGACLDYTSDDLPKFLAEMPFSWHLHLPLDLPWHKGEEYVAEICRQIACKTAFLKPVAAVLHPPNGSEAKLLLKKFAQSWQNCLPLAIENTPQCDVICFGEKFLSQNDFGLCLDLGHCLGYGQKKLISSSLPEIASICHWNVCAKGEEHQPLTHWSLEQLQMANNLAKRLPARCLHVLEMFSWDKICKSLAIFRKILAGKNIKNCADESFAL